MNIIDVCTETRERILIDKQYKMSEVCSILLITSS